MTKRTRWLFLAAALVAVNASLWIAQFGFALPPKLTDYFFGPKMIRAEVVLKGSDGVLHDFLFDQGRVKAVTASSITLVERASPGVVTIQVSPTAKVKLNGRLSALSALRRGMQATTIHDGSAPADTVFATGRR